MDLMSSSSQGDVSDERVVGISNSISYVEKDTIGVTSRRSSYHQIGLPPRPKCFEKRNTIDLTEEKKSKGLRAAGHL